MPAESVSFFTAVNDSRCMSHGLPQPVVARNSGLVKASAKPFTRLDVVSRDMCSDASSVQPRVMCS
jgi:hypothetical protein